VDLFVELWFHYEPIKKVLCEYAYTTILSEVNEAGDQAKVATTSGEWMKGEKAHFHDKILVSSCSTCVVPFLFFSLDAKIIPYLVADAHH
jgi:hypothetical protein